MEMDVVMLAEAGYTDANGDSILGPAQPSIYFTINGTVDTTGIQVQEDTIYQQI